MLTARLVAIFLMALTLNVSAAQAERPIVDLHRLDSYFELFAVDSSVPWKPATVRLDTYSSAPVNIAIFAVDPATVLTAGSNSGARPVDTGKHRPFRSFTFTPPGGYQFQSNQVDLGLGNREGFFVVEARRGDVGEQVWINRSRVGLFSKATPGGLLFYGTDLGTGLPLARMRVQLVVNNAFVTAATGNDGIYRWNRASRPVFALAQWGGSYAFLSLLPQAPVPATIVGVRTDSAVLHAGQAVRIAGFARTTRTNGVLRAATGSALISLRAGARTLASHRVSIDEAGAFSTSLTVPAETAAGDYTVLAQVGNGVGGATVHVDANAGDLSLDVSPQCSGVCDFRQDVPLLVHASRGGVTVDVTVVRSPHVYAGYVPDTTPWATTHWLSESVRTDERGNATVDVPRPLDDLASTYGVQVASGGATAETRVIVPTAQAAIRVSVDRPEQSLGSPLSFDVYAEELDGKPLAGASADVELRHGNSVQRQRITLDGDGHARGSFSSPEVGSNIVLASVDRDGRATDAAGVQIDPQAPSSTTDGRSSDVRLSAGGTLRAGEEIAVDADAAGSQGDALITFENAAGAQYDVVKTDGGHASAKLRALNAAGELSIGAAFVRDGAIEWNALPVALTAPGRPRLASLTLRCAHFAPNEPARVVLDGGAAQRGTFIVRISRGTPSGSAVFSSAPALLAVGVTTTQNSAPTGVTWHPWVDSTGNHAQVLGFVRRTQPPPDESLAQAQSETVTWDVERGGADGVAVALPGSGGRYLVSVLDIADDGSVSSGSSFVEVH